MKTITITFGCLSTLLALCLGAMVIATSCEAIAAAGAAKVAARERTAQVEIEQVQATERTQINVDASVEVARINADATKKTSFAFSLFYLVRVFTWLVGVAAVLWVAVLIKEGRLGKWTSSN